MLDEIKNEVGEYEEGKNEFELEPSDYEEFED